jgi:DNA repair ATPase RecN
MRIAAVKVDNYRRLYQVEIHPEADRAIMLIGGANGNGKSSLLGALSAAFGGKKMISPDPVRHGAPEAGIWVKLDDGTEIRRVIAQDGETTLEVRDRQGPIRSPQALLDRLIGTRFLDPLAFLRLPPKEQRAALMRVIPGASKIEEIDAQRERVFTQRREVGRDLDKAQGELARLPPTQPVPEPIDVAALNEEARQLAAQQRAGKDLQSRLMECQNATQHAAHVLAGDQAEIARLQALLVEAEKRVQQQLREVAACTEREQAAARDVEIAAAAWREIAPRRLQVDADLRRAGEHNRGVYAAEAEANRRREVETTVNGLRGQVDQLTTAIAAFDRDKAEILAGAMLPVDGLAISGQGLELGGVPFDQASDADRWRVALAIAAAASPDLDDIWIRDGALLDEQSLAIVERHCAATGRRAWVERVGTRDPGVIEIRDGRVAGDQP